MKFNFRIALLMQRLRRCYRFPREVMFFVLRFYFLVQGSAEDKSKPVGYHELFFPPVQKDVFHETE